MKITSKATISACETALLEVAGIPSAEILQFPTRLRYLSAGGEISWAQFLITYAQKFQSESAIRSYASSSDDDQIRKFCNRLYGLIASLATSKIIAKGNRVNLTEIYRATALSRLKEIQSKEAYYATRGPSVEVVAADHISRSHPYLLYRRDSIGRFHIRSREEFVKLANYLLSKTDVMNKTPNPADVRRAFGNILFETFKNTEDHALFDIDGKRLGISFRLFQMSIITPDKGTLNLIGQDYQPFENFFSRQHPEFGRRQMSFLQLSILDSGPGFAQRYTNTRLEKLTIDEEAKAIKDCFGQNTTKGHSRFGQGLCLVRELLRKNDGFLRIRSGRLSLHYDSADDHGTPDIVFESWCPKHLTKLAPVAGALLTILIPVGGQ